MWDLIVSVPDHCLSFYFALQQQQKSKKMCHLMFSVKIAHVTCMLDNNLFINRVL